MIDMPKEKQKDYTTLLVYGSIVTLSLVFTIVSSFCFYLTALKASENLHNKMTKAVIEAPVIFFDTNPVGRILNRFSKDIGSMESCSSTISHCSALLFILFQCHHLVCCSKRVVIYLLCSTDNVVYLPCKVLFEIFSGNQEARGNDL